MQTADSSFHPYYKRKAALATMHGKAREIGRPLICATGIELLVPEGLNTDQFGTFSGETTRIGTPREAAVRKAQCGMKASGLLLGLASEGSFGPHHLLPFVAENHEIIVFLDDELEIQITEQVLSVETNYNHIDVSSFDDLTAFLPQVHFPSHALIVRPNIKEPDHPVFKGVQTLQALHTVLQQCTALSADGFAHIETDMRAHMNPMRRRVIRRTALKLARKLASRCSDCGCSGWGVIDFVRGLPCEWCGTGTELHLAEIHGCTKCHYRMQFPRKDGLKAAPPAQCPHCNP